MLGRANTNNCAIFAPGGFAKPRAMFGKDVANASLFQALLKYGAFDQLRFCMHKVTPPENVVAVLAPKGEAGSCVSTASIHDPAALEGFGTLVRGSADLSDLAWRRRRSIGDRSHSLVGLVHCIAPPAIREYIANAAVAPVQPWDALNLHFPGSATQSGSYVRGLFFASQCPLRRGKRKDLRSHASGATAGS